MKIQDLIAIAEELEEKGIEVDLKASIHTLYDVQRRISCQLTDHQVLLWRAQANGGDPSSPMPEPRLSR